jgi:dCMP deaminase
MDQRLPWPEYFMRISFLVAERSTCLRRKVGSIAVKDKRILATGYNGAPAGTAHCLDIGCLRDKLGIPSGQRHELCRGLHAEQNVIIQAATHGVSITGADLYCTTQPCIICTKMLINCGVRNIHYAEGYPDELSRDMLKEAGVNFDTLPRPDNC